MRYLSCLALIVASLLVPAPTEGGFLPAVTKTDPIAMGYMHQDQARSAIETLFGGRSIEEGRTLGRGRWMFDPGTGRDTETSLAVDPTDPDRVLVAWQEQITRIWTARTENGGRTWRVEMLEDPATQQAAGGQEGFDPTAAVGPDGTMYVLMGVTEVPGGLTLVRLDDDEWSFHPVHVLGDVHAWDAMHLAVAPDTGDLHAVAQSIDHRGIGYWKSSDRGDTWSTVRFPHFESPQGAAQVAQDGFDYWPRVAAGPRGLVLIVTKALLALGSDIRTTASSDGGDTFGPLTRLTDEALSGRFVGVPPAFDGSQAIAGFVSFDDIVIADANKGVGPWELKRFPRADPEWAPDWSTVAASKGAVWILHTEQSDGPTWRVLLTKIRGDSVKTITLAEASAAQPRGTGAGDEYGGLDITKDGCVWASWAQPWTTGSPVIMVAKRC